MPESADWSLNQKVDNVAAQVQVLQGKVDATAANVADVKAAVDAQALYNLATFAQQIIPVWWPLYTAADAAVTTQQVIAGVANQHIVIVGVSLGPELSGGLGPSGSVLRSIVELVLTPHGGGGVSFQSGISPGKPSVNSWIPPGAVKLALGVGVDAVYLTAWGAGKQYFDLGLAYYLSPV